MTVNITVMTVGRPLMSVNDTLNSRKNNQIVECEYTTMNADTITMTCQKSTLDDNMESRVSLVSRT